MICVIQTSRPGVPKLVCGPPMVCKLHSGVLQRVYGKTPFEFYVSGPLQRPLWKLLRVLVWTPKLSPLLWWTGKESLCSMWSGCHQPQLSLVSVQILDSKYEWGAGILAVSGGEGRSALEHNSIEYQNSNRKQTDLKKIQALEKTGSVTKLGLILCLFAGRSYATVALPFGQC